MVSVILSIRADHSSKISRESYNVVTIARPRLRQQLSLAINELKSQNISKVSVFYTKDRECFKLFEVLSVYQNTCVCRK